MTKGRTLLLSATLLAVTGYFVVTQIGRELLDPSLIRAHYPSAAAAQADGAIERGWIPRTLPVSARDISETHDLDNNTGHGTFRFEEVEADSLRLRLGDPTADQLERLPTSSAALERDGYTFYVDRQFVLAINWRSQHAEFWIDFCEFIIN